MKTLRDALLARSTKTFTSFLFGLLLWLSPQLAMGQPVYTGDVTFTSQAEVDAWSPAYTSITGFLRISGTEITNLMPLQNITSIGGYFLIYNSALTNLVGLNNLTSVEGGITIQENAALTSVVALNNLTSTASGLLIINNNAVLTSLEGLSNLSSFAGLAINNNAALTSLTGLNDFSSIGGVIEITNNAALTSLAGLENLVSIGGYFHISGTALTSLAALNNLTYIGGELAITGTNDLVDLTGLNNLSSIGGGLLLFSNDALTDLMALDNLSSIPGHFWIFNNAALTNLVGMDNISSVGGDFRIEFNALLSNCCAIHGLLNTPDAIGGFIIIQNNQTGCDSEAEINTYCDDGDLDNDGYTVEEGDCDDNNADVHPGALEVCGNGIDDNCNGLTDEEYTQIKIIKDGQQNVSCYGGADGSIDIHATGGLAPRSFEWSNGATTEDVTGLPAGTHTVTVVDALGHCRTKSFTLTQPNQLTLTFTHIDVSCHGGSDGEATVQANGGSGGKTYLWSNSQTTKKIKDLTAGTYSVTVTDSKGCTAMGSVAVGEPAELLITGVVIASVGGNYQLTVSATGGNQPYKYRRSKPNGGWTNWQTSNVLSNVPAGVYTIQAKDNNACIASVTLPVPGFFRSPQAEDRAKPQVFNDELNDGDKALPEAEGALLLYPNPAQNQLSLVKKEYAGKKADISITNNLGVTLLRQEVEAIPAHALTFDLGGLQDGLYLLTIRAEGFSVVTKRFVIMR